jgi:hypothetical protein
VLDDQPAPLRIDDEEAESEELLGRSSSVPDVHVQAAEDKRRSRNSVYYSQSGADALMETRGQSLSSPKEDDETDSSDDEESTPDSDVDNQSIPQSSPLMTPSPLGSHQTDSYFDAVSHIPIRTHERTQQLATDKGLQIQVPTGGRSIGRASPTSPIGFPKSPRPIAAGAR